MTIARYSITYALKGCYLPDNPGHVMEFHSRREMAEFIRYEIDFYEFPKATFRQADIRRLWRLIRNAGSSSVYHFSIDHGGYTIAFYGLTEEEYNAAMARED